MLSSPYAGLLITSGAATQALTTTGGQMVAWAAAGGSNNLSSSADSADIKPDKANSRILVGAPGVFRATFVLSGTNASGATVIAQLRKGGSSGTTLTPRGRANIGTSTGTVIFDGIFQVTAADLTTYGGVANSGDSSGPFTGDTKGVANMVQIDVLLSVAASTDTLTIEEASLTIQKL